MGTARGALRPSRRRNQGVPFVLAQLDQLESFAPSPPHAIGSGVAAAEAGGEEELAE